MTRTRKCARFLILALLLAACDAPVPQPQAVAGGDAEQGRVPLAWIDAPLDGSSIPLAPYEVVYHGGDWGGVAQIELSVNGQVVASESGFGSSQTLVTMRYVWTPPAPGNYTLRARTQNRWGDWGEHASATVTVGAEAETPPPTPEPAQEATPIPPTPVPPTPVPPTLTPIPPTPVPPTGTPIPTSTPTPTDLPPLIIRFPTATPAPQAPTMEAVSLARDTFYTDGTCGRQDNSLMVTVHDPNGVANVTFYYRLREKGGGATSDWMPVPVKPFSFSGRLVNPPSALWVWPILDASTVVVGVPLGYVYTMEYYVVAANTLGLTTQSPTYQNVTLDTHQCIK
jgi:hypothetical protein